MDLKNLLNPGKALIFRIVHIDNVEWILTHGLHCKTAGIRAPNYVEIGIKELIDKRSEKAVLVPPYGMLSDYIPFYFTPYSPMLYNIKTGRNVTKRPMEDIVILATSLHRLVELGAIFHFTDRHAYLKYAKSFTDLADMDKIDWEKLQNRDFQKDMNDLDRFERYQAEALVHRTVPVNALQGVVCYGIPQQQRVSAMVEAQALTMKVVAHPTWFF